MSNLLQRWGTRLSSGFILAFHDIPAARLSGLVEALYPARPIPLTELVDRSKQGKSTFGLFAITVDDGVGETVRSLSRLFLNRGWPATFYMPTGYIDSRDGMGFQWWRSVMPYLPQRRIELKSGALDLSQPGAARDLAGKLEAMWHSERMEAYLPLTLELAEIAAREHGLPPGAIRTPEPISWPEVTELSKTGLICFESHGVSHAAMSTLTDDEMMFEMEHSRDVVSGHTGLPCRHLAYPFGSDQSIGPRAAAIAQLFYDSAVTMTLGGVDSANPWLLPRIPLYGANSTWVAWMKILLKCNRIIPPAPDRARPETPNAPGRLSKESPAGASPPKTSGQSPAS